MILRMTRTQTRPYGVVTPSSRQPLLEAMLRAFVWLVSNVASLFGMTINRNTRDWHTDAAHENQLPTSNDIQKEAKTTQPSFSGKAEGRIPGIPVVSTQGTATYSLCATNQDARHKVEHDSVGADVLTIWKRGTRVPREGGDPASAQRALLTRTSLPAHTDERRYPGRASRLVRACSFNPAPAAKPFLDSDASS